MFLAKKVEFPLRKSCFFVSKGKLMSTITYFNDNVNGNGNQFLSHTDPTDLTDFKQKP